MTVDKSTLDSWTLMAMGPELDDAEKAFRDQFVREYLIDYNPIAAAMRLGFTKDYAKDYAQKYMDEPYVQQQIKAKELDDPLVEDKKRGEKIVMAGLFKQANDYGPGSSHSARVSALSKLASIYGMEAAVKTKTEVTVTTPVKFYIPSNGRDEIGQPTVETTPVAPQ